MKELVEAYKSYVVRAYKEHVVSFMKKYGYTKIELAVEPDREGLIFSGGNAKPYVTRYPWVNPAPHADYSVADKLIKQGYIAALKVIGMSGKDDLWIHTDFVLTIVKAKHGDNMSIRVEQE